MPAIDIFQRRPAAAPGAAPAAPKRTLPQRAGTRQSHCTLQWHQHSKVPKGARTLPQTASCRGALQQYPAVKLHPAVPPALRIRRARYDRHRASVCCSSTLCPPQGSKACAAPCSCTKAQIALQHQHPGSKAHTAIDILEWHPRRNQYPGSIGNSSYYT